MIAKQTISDSGQPKGQFIAIKFRAWDWNEKRMREVTCLYLETEQIQVDGKDILNKNEYNLLQFTGQLDINDVLIFEGDICRAPHHFGPGDGKLENLR